MHIKAIVSIKFTVDTVWKLWIEAMSCASNLMTFLLNYSMKPVLPWFLRKEKKKKHQEYQMLNECLDRENSEHFFKLVKFYLIYFKCWELEIKLYIVLLFLIEIRL